MMDPYLKQVRQFKLRKAMTAFRITAHKLEIETILRVKKMGNKFLEMICTICKERNILVKGDEEHDQLTSCVGFVNEKNKLFRYFEEKDPSFNPILHHLICTKIQNQTIFFIVFQGWTSHSQKRFQKFQVLVKNNIFNLLPNGNKAQIYYYFCNFFSSNMIIQKCCQNSKCRIII